MFSGIAFLVIIFKLAIFIGVIVFAIKIVNRLKDISESQKSIAKSQAKLVELVANKQKIDPSPDN